MDQGFAAWSQVLAKGSPSPDLLAQWKQFLDQWIAAWARVLEEAMGTEVFAQALSSYMQQWLALQAPARKVAEESMQATLQTLGIPSRGQVAEMARQLTDLQDRIEEFEDRLGAMMARVEELHKSGQENPRTGAKQRQKERAKHRPKEREKGQESL